MVAYLSLGSNVGDRLRNLREAVNRLDAAGIAVRAVSAVYETEPQGNREQAWFLNCVVAVDTVLAPRALLEQALAVEAAMGRERVVRWGPRNIDVDLLLYGAQRVDEPGLTIPHPRLAERAFALVPLAEIAPNAAVGAAGPAAALAAARLADAGQGVRRWGSMAPSAGPGPMSFGAPAPVTGPLPLRSAGGVPVPSRHGSRSRRDARDASSTRVQVLARLRDASGSALSGTALSRELGVSRAAVWKHVRALRAQGYAIAGAAGSGYRLPGGAAMAAPLTEADVLRPGRHIVGRTVHLLGAVDSTNARAKQLGLEGTPDGTVVIAEQQTAGRGRNGRSFLSPPGGVYLSVVLRPRVPPSHAVRLTLAAAVAMCDALEVAVGLVPMIKWPNDVLLPAGKVCGILLEMVAAEDCVEFVVLGCGVNVLALPAVEGACSLRSAGARVGRAPVAAALLDALDACYTAFTTGGWPDLLRRWRQRCATLGQQVAVSGLDGGRILGRAVDVTPDGALVVQAPDGVHVVLAGDVAHVRRA